MRQRALILLIPACIFIQSCSKTQSASIEGEVRHHETLIPTAKVYVKYGTNLWPGADVSEYDTMVVADINAYYSIDNFDIGWHYVYATGYDPQISDSVSGGVPFEIKKKKSTLNKNVPVTE